MYPNKELSGTLGPELCTRRNEKMFRGAFRLVRIVREIQKLTLLTSSNIADFLLGESPVLAIITLTMLLLLSC